MNIPLIVGIIILIIWLIWKTVYEPSLVVSVDKPEYQKGEEITISGTLTKTTGDPLPGKPISLAVQPPSGDAYTLPSVMTEVDGSFTSSWIVEPDTVLGEHTLTARYLLVSAQTTFIQNPARFGIWRIKE